MHTATKQHIAGMLNMIRTACSSIEAALSSDEYLSKKTDRIENPEPDAEMYLTEQQEDMLGEMLGLTEPKAQKKTSGKKLNEKEKVSIS